MRPVMPESRSGILIKLNRQLVLKLRKLKPKRLPARTSADLHHPIPHPRDLRHAGQRSGAGVTQELAGNPPAP